MIGVGSIIPKLSESSLNLIGETLSGDSIVWCPVI